MSVFEVKATPRNTEMSTADLYGEPKDQPFAVTTIPSCPKCGGIFVRLAADLCRCTKCKHEWTEAVTAKVSVETGHAPSLPGMAAEGAGPKFDPPAERYRAIKARNPEAIVYLSVCCGREQTHSGATRYCAFCGRECTGVVYEPELTAEARSHGEESSGDGAGSAAVNQTEGAGSSPDSPLQEEALFEENAAAAMPSVAPGEELL